MKKNYLLPLMTSITALYFSCATFSHEEQTTKTARWFLPQLRFEEDGYRCSRNVVLSVNNDGQIYQFTGMEFCQQGEKQKNIEINWTDTNNDGTIDKVCQLETKITPVSEKKNKICDDEEMKTVDLINYLSSWLQNRIDL